MWNLYLHDISTRTHQTAQVFSFHRVHQFHQVRERSQEVQEFFDYAAHDLTSKGKRTMSSLNSKGKIRKDMRFGRGHSNVEYRIVCKSTQVLNTSGAHIKKNHLV